MPFKKGHAKLGGRKKGVPNKERKIAELCQQTGKDPRLVLFEFLNSEDAHLRFNAAKELIKYVEPQLKAVEVKADVHLKPSVLIKTDGTRVEFYNQPVDSNQD